MVVMKRGNTMNHNTQQLIDAVKELRRILSNDGELTVVRKDGSGLGIGDIMEFGRVTERIDICLEKIDRGE